LSGLVKFGLGVPLTLMSSSSDSSDPPAIATRPAYVPRTHELWILINELPGYCTLPVTHDALPDRNDYVWRVSQQLRKWSDYWTCRTVRLWFNSHRDHPLAPRPTQISSEPAPTPVISPDPPVVAGSPVRNDESVPDGQEYALAATHVGFRVLMSNKDVAVPFVNTVVKAIVSSFRTVDNCQVANPIFPAPYGEMRMDFYGKADGHRDIVIDIQARFEDYIGRDAIFDVADRLARGYLPRGSGHPGDRPSGVLPKQVYAIQFFNYDLRELPEGVGPDQNFLMPAGIFVQTINQIYLIRIALARMGMTFPVTDEVSSGWTPFEWWLYLLQFSDRFTVGEIKRCRRLGMPPSVLSGLESLRRAAWPEEVQSEYRHELLFVITDFTALGREREKAEREWECKGMLLVLIGRFLVTGSLGDEVVPSLPPRIAATFVRETWEASSDPKKANGRYQSFLSALRAIGVILT
jgi:hypothetical protein